MDPTTLVTVLSATLLGVLANFLATYLKEFVSWYRSKSNGEKLEVTSPSGTTTKIEIKKNMTEEEVQMLVDQLTKLQKR